MTSENHAGMILEGENQSTGRKPCSSAAFSTTNSARTDPGANSAFTARVRRLSAMAIAQHNVRWLGLCMEAIAVYSYHHTKHIVHTLSGQNAV